jgi:hypothetical protein
MPLPIRILFLVHALVTLAASVVLVYAPGLIPSAIGIDLSRDESLLPYLLAGVEAGIAVLSFNAAFLRDAAGIRAIAIAFVVMHALTALLEALAITQGTDPLLWGNVALRVVVAGLFVAVAVRFRSRTPERDV